jgi:general secretion pathway protein M
MILISRLPGRDRALALLYYAAAIVALLLVIWLALAELGARYAAYSETTALFARMESRHAPNGEGKDGGSFTLPGSPFIEAASLTIAGADLQKHVTALVQDSGGNVLSSQVDLQQSEGSTDHVSLAITTELDQSAVQKLLYDLEAGMPFLFIDRLLIQPVQQHGADASGSRVRIQLTISGQWRQAEP